MHHPFLPLSTPFFQLVLFLLVHVIVNESELPDLTSSEVNRIHEGLREIRELRRKPLVKTTIQKEIKQESKPIVEKPAKKEPSSSEKPKESLLYDFEIDRAGMSDSDYKLAKQLQAALRDSNNGLPKDAQSLFKEIGITSKDFDRIGEEVKRFEQEKTKAPTSNHNYSQLAKLERLLSQDPSLFDTYNAWIADVEKAIGKDVGNPSILTEEDMKKIPPAPEKLQELARFMMSVHK